MRSLENNVCSIIMPVYNGEKFIADAIESVLLQSHQYWELLIVDDASTDGTVDAVESFVKRDDRIQLFRNADNQGVSKSRNRAIAQSIGEYIAFLDADDRWYPDKLTMQIAILQKNGDVCYTSYAFMDIHGYLTGKKYIVPPETNFRQMLSENVVGCSTVMACRTVIEGTTFRTGYAHEDFVLWLDLLKNGCRFVGCSNILVNYRIFGGRSSDKKKAAKNRWKIYREFLQLGRVKSSFFFCLYMIKGIKKYYFL